MIVVSDTSAIINLAAIGQLSLLHQLYNRIIIPTTVFKEIMVQGIELPGAKEVASLSWIEKISPEDQSLVVSLKNRLDAGEAEAVALALQIKADFLLMDERRGRIEARKLGVRVIGLLSAARSETSEIDAGHSASA